MVGVVISLSPVWSPLKQQFISQTHLQCTHMGLTRAHVQKPIRPPQLKTGSPFTAVNSTARPTIIIPQEGDVSARFALVRSQETANLNPSISTVQVNSSALGGRIKAEPRKKCVTGIPSPLLCACLAFNQMHQCVCKKGESRFLYSRRKEISVTRSRRRRRRRLLKPENPGNSSQDPPA